MTQPSVFTVILNTNRRDDTLECLASLQESTYQNQTIIVLDNSSSDGSVAAIRSRVPSRCRSSSWRENRGYAGNNNVGIAAALAQGADWVFVLNEDTILAPDCLAHMVAAGESDPQIGIVGPHGLPSQRAGGDSDRPAACSGPTGTRSIWVEMNRISGQFSRAA